jgi:hypothetical protein
VPGDVIAQLAGDRMAEAIVPTIGLDDRYPRLVGR